MKNYYVDTCGEMRKIFAEHCNLSCEQYEAISGRFVDLIAEIQESGEGGCGSLAEAEQKAENLGVIFEFLLDTKELTLKEYNDLCNMAGRIYDDAHAMREAGA